jgi:CRP-like cAMP-binding protein
MINIKQLASMCAVTNYPAGYAFFNKNDIGEEFYIILKGKIGIYISDNAGSVLKVSELDCGDYFGEMALLGNKRRTATVRSLSDVTVAIVNNDNFEEVIKCDTSLALRIMKSMSQRIEHLNNEVLRLSRSEPK